MYFAHGENKILMSDVFLSFNDPVRLTGFYKSEWINRLHVYPSSSSFRLSSTLFFAVVFLLLSFFFFSFSFFTTYKDLSIDLSPVLLSCCVFFFLFKCCQRKLNWFVHHTLSTHWLPASRDAWIERARHLAPRTLKERAPRLCPKTVRCETPAVSATDVRAGDRNGKCAVQWRVSVSKLIGDWLLSCGQVQQWGAY